MEYVLGIDGGGTQTRAAVLDTDGRFCGTGRSGPANVDDVGEERAQQHIAEAVAEARRAAGLDTAPFAAAFLGLAGIVSEQDRAVIRRIAHRLDLAPPDRMGVDHDCRVALAGGLSGRPGIVLIAGTGSSCYGRNARGESWRAGGWGDLISDEGSGYWLGTEAMKAAVRAHDGRGPTTVLVARLMQRLALSGMNDLMHRLYVEGLSRTEIAALAPMVFEAARDGDDEARALIRRGVEELAACVQAVAKQLGLKECEAVLVGGLLRAGDVFEAPLRRILADRLPRCSISRAELPPALGAGLLALKALPDADVTGAVERMLRRSAETFSVPEYAAVQNR